MRRLSKVRPRLKTVAWQRIDGGLCLVYDRRARLLLEDPIGDVEQLLELLRDGHRTVAELAVRLEVAESDVADAIAVLDDVRLIEDSDGLENHPEFQRRYVSNLAFFESFSTLAKNRADFQRQLRRSHVLLLGTGGLNSNTIPHLCGLGVGRLTLLDADTIEEGNFARQYLYRWADLGSSKVKRAEAWVRAFDPTIETSVVERFVDAPEIITALLERYEPDVVMSGIDSPGDIDDWVNAGCVGSGVPYVRAGMYVTQGLVWSVDPGRSACRQCITLDPTEVAEIEIQDTDLADQLAGARLYNSLPRPNRGIGPVAGLLGSLAAFEVLRYLVNFEPPAYAGRPIYIDFAAGCAMQQVEWKRSTSCVVCKSASSGRQTATSGALAGEEVIR